MLELLISFWKDFRIQICVIAAIVGVLYLAGLSNASMNPWTLWRQEWEQDSRANQHRIASYREQKDCIEEQWKKLREALQLKEQGNAIIAKNAPTVLNFRSVFIQESWTIFEFKKSLLSLYSKKKSSLPAEMQTEIVSTVSFFCAPTASFYGLWPYHRPSYSAASDMLKRLGEKTLAIKANQLFEK